MAKRSIMDFEPHTVAMTLERALNKAHEFFPPRYGDPSDDFYVCSIKHAFRVETEVAVGVNLGVFEVKVSWSSMNEDPLTAVAAAAQNLEVAQKAAILQVALDDMIDFYIDRNKKMDVDRWRLALDIYRASKRSLEKHNSVTSE